MEKLLTLQDVIAIVRMGRSWIYREIALGRFPSPIRIGERSSRWRESDIQKWIDDRIAEREAV